ncbi:MULTISPECIES: heavy-metal-associated domain-containing protein [Streptococcus]|uniref:Heavy-metal-associated domain protein n=1 Tax=Streptococcus cristatus TaxID=45634 RepID=A0A3R9J5N6_STRCR|nr:heavy metal-associated domain-containing protein [Streptococcus cristatus]MBC6977693.1 heavy-metal-associated domain-containing protein [Streptococcus cristatus]RSI44089.1 Heavy-metal-associated domain protein [Streptococcus cristatus]
MKQTVQLENLSCQNCVKHVTQHFLSMEGVSDVTVDLDKQTAEVIADRSLSVEDYQVALSKTIYKVLGVQDS